MRPSLNPPHTQDTNTHTPSAEAQSPPTLTYTATPGPYIAIAIDLDAPFPSFDVLGPILHWVQPGLRGADASTGLTASDVPFVADYIGPAPPPGSAPHRYVFLLYAQPEGFDGAAFAPAGGKPLSLWLRMRFDLDVFEKKAGLGPVLAVNYFNSN